MKGGGGGMQGRRQEAVCRMGDVRWGEGSRPSPPSRIVRMNPIAVILVNRVTRYKNWTRDTFLTDNADLSWLAERGTGASGHCETSGSPLGVSDGGRGWVENSVARRCAAAQVSDHFIAHRSFWFRVVYALCVPRRFVVAA